RRELPYSPYFLGPTPSPPKRCLFSPEPSPSRLLGKPIRATVSPSCSPKRGDPLHHPSGDKGKGDEERQPQSERRLGHRGDQRRFAIEGDAVHLAPNQVVLGVDP